MTPGVGFKDWKNKLNIMIIILEKDAVVAGDSWEKGTRLSCSDTDARLAIESGVARAETEDDVKARTAAPVAPESEPEPKAEPKPDPKKKAAKLGN